MSSETGPVERRELTVEGTRLSFLHAGGSAGRPPLLLLHGTFWSRVWQPVLPALASVAECVALDFPGFGRSDGELDVASASVPALSAVARSVVDALGWTTYAVAGHDIGGGIAQQLAVDDDRVARLALVNGVLLDSWPVPGVVRFRDPAVRSATSAEDLVESRRDAMSKAVARRLSDDEVEDYVSPWHSPARARSWMSMAAAANARYTTDLVPDLAARRLPTLLVWGEDDEFQRIEYAERFVQQFPWSVLDHFPGRHIPQEDDPERVAGALTAFLSEA